jgi:hypothetical protein
VFLVYFVLQKSEKPRSKKIAEGTLLNPLHTARASQLLSSIARRGAAGMPRVFRRAGKPVRKTLDKSEKRRTNRQDSRFACIAPAGRGTWMCRVILRYVGGLFFGYFLLAAQKKVSRLSVREPTSKKVSRSVTFKKYRLEVFSTLITLPARH